MAEAYDGDPAKLTDGDVLEALRKSGFDAVYDAPPYQLIHQIYEGPKWANDIDYVIPQGERFHASLRYAENHDEVRLANPQRWAGLGSRVGRPVCAILFGLGSGPVMIYNGQEVGEPAIGAEGFAGDDGRTSIFDYWCLPELARWVNGHRYDGGGLSPEQRALRSWYGALLQVCAEPAFAKGVFRPLNGDNVDNPAFGRVGEETASGHWLYAFLRFEESGGQAFLVVVNLHGEETLRGVRVRLPRERWEELGLGDGPLRLHERLSGQWAGETVREEALNEGIALADLPPCSACYLELERP